MIFYPLWGEIRTYQSLVSCAQGHRQTACTGEGKHPLTSEVKAKENQVSSHSSCLTKVINYINNDMAYGNRAKFPLLV